MKIILECQIDGIASKVDGTVSIKIGTQELDKNSAGDLFGLRGKHCKVLISDSNITELEAELVDNSQLVSGKKHKTESQRLRAVLFLYAQQKGVEPDTDYKTIMNGLIEHYRSKLDQ